jgi:hypothetical protein
MHLRAPVMDGLVSAPALASSGVSSDALNSEAKAGNMGFDRTSPFHKETTGADLARRRDETGASSHLTSLPRLLYLR